MKNRTISSGIACNLDIDLVSACVPLFQEESIEIIEWSFDTLYNLNAIPSWFEDLIQDFSNSERLIGHGVYFSILSGKWSSHQEKWLKELKQKCQKYNFSHISEHFGFMSGADFHNGAPLPAPFTKTVCQIGQDRLMRIHDACECPVGIENLALALNSDDVKRHGEFLNELVEPINGFIILDLHNLYCQLHNFDLEIGHVLSSYPLERVREIHISGGSWQQSNHHSAKKIRRDTHDHAVPKEVFELLSHVIEYCPNLNCVILEQLGRSLNTQVSQIQFQTDFKTMTKIVSNACFKSHDNYNNFLPKRKLFFSKIPKENHSLNLQQTELSSILENAVDVENAKSLLSKSSLSTSDWRVEDWEGSMIETALNIAKKWKKGFKESIFHL